MSRCLCLLWLAAVLCFAAGDAPADGLERVSLATAFVLGDEASRTAAISGDGALVAFQSTASNLVPGDTNGVDDLFVHSFVTGETIRVSVLSDGSEGHETSGYPSVSGDGRYVAFASLAVLSGSDTNARWDVYVHDMRTGVTELVSRSTGGGQGNLNAGFPSISADGRCVAFHSDSSDLVPDDSNGATDVFVYDRQTGVLARVSVASDGSQASSSSTLPSISADGRYVAFVSYASDLVTGDTNGAEDIFVHDRTTGETTRVSVASDGTEASAPSYKPRISPDGRCVAFESAASDLVPGDSNGKCDIFVRDRETGQTARVSVATGGIESDADCFAPTISEDGRYVAFYSGATNLAAGDTNGVHDVFRHDRATGETVLLSRHGLSAGNGSSRAPAMSWDGIYIAFESDASDFVVGDTNGYTDVFRHYWYLGSNAPASVAGREASDHCFTAMVSADGRYVTYHSAAANLVSQDTNGCADVFVTDRATPSGQTTRASVQTGGGEADQGSYQPSISSDGRYVAFHSSATNLVPADTNSSQDIFVRDRVAGETSRVSVASDGTQVTGHSVEGRISGDGRWVAFSSQASGLVLGDLNATSDIFVHDRETGATERVSVSTAGTEGNGWSAGPSISQDGRYVAFWSAAADLVDGDTNAFDDIFVRDREAGTTTRVSVSTAGAESDGGSGGPSISADGRYVAFESIATNLVAGDSNGTVDVFVHDRQTGETVLVSLDRDGAQGSSGSSHSGISADGRLIVFRSGSKLAPDDTNASSDVYLRDSAAGTTRLVSTSYDSRMVNDASDHPCVSPDGRFVVFESRASNLVVHDTNGVQDIFLRDRFLFPDVPFDFWAFYDIDGCVQDSIVAGYPDGCYHPDYVVTRDQMAVYISRAVAGGDDYVLEPLTGPSFPDVPPEHWAYRYVEYAAARDIVQGYWDGYHPGDDVDRAQMAVFVARAMCDGEAGVPDPGCLDPIFPDVDCDFWARKYIQFIEDVGVTGGYPDGLYHHEYACTRDQMAVYVARAFWLPR